MPGGPAQPRVPGEQGRPGRLGHGHVDGVVGGQLVPQRQGAAEQLRVPFAGISEATRERLAAVLEPGLPATNPLDAWGTGNDADRPRSPARGG